MGVAATPFLHLGNMEAPTPTTIPGGRVIDTLNFVSMVSRPRLTPIYVLDALGANERIPNALPMAFAAGGASFDDPIEFQLGQQMQNATGGNHAAPIIVDCAGPTCWMSYNVALRLIRLGYTDVYWYRGGLEAWKQAAMMTQPW